MTTPCTLCQHNTLAYYAGIFNAGLLWSHISVRGVVQLIHFVNSKIDEVVHCCYIYYVTRSDKTSLIAQKHTYSLNLVYLLLHMS